MKKATQELEGGDEMPTKIEWTDEVWSPVLGFNDYYATKNGEIGVSHTTILRIWRREIWAAVK